MAPPRVKRQKWVDQPKDYLPEGYLPQPSPATVTQPQSLPAVATQPQLLPATVTQPQSSDPQGDQQAAIVADACAILPSQHAYDCECGECKYVQTDVMSSLDGFTFVFDDNLPKDYLPEDYIAQPSPGAVTQPQFSDPDGNPQAAMMADAYAVLPSRHDHDCECDECKHVQMDSTSSLDGQNFVFDDDQDPESRRSHRLNVKRTPELLTSEDNFRQLPNYCPPTDNLGKNGVSLLRRIQHDRRRRKEVYYINDPDVVGMHEEERTLVAALKITGARYLANKRKVFKYKTWCLSKDRPFYLARAGRYLKGLSTHKGREMMLAFKAVRWLEDEHFLKHIQFPSVQAPSVEVPSQPISVD